MNLVKLSCLALAVAAASTQLAMAGQADAKGFIEDSELNLLNRNYYFNRDFKNKPGSQSYREEWAHGVMAEFASGFTQGTVGFGADAYGYMGIKLDSGRGRTGTGLLPISDEGRPQDEYGEAGGAVKLRVSDSVLKYGEMRTEAPVFATSHSRLLPETATGFHVASGEIDGLALEAGHFTAYNNRNSTNSDDELNLNYGSGEIGKTIDFAGGWYSVNDDLSLGLYASRFEDTWNQYYGNLNYTLGISEGQSLNFDLNLYRTSDTGDALQGDIDNTTYSLAATYGLGSHSILLAYQRVNGDTPFDYVGGDSIFLANSMQYSDFNAPNEKSWRVGYGYDWADLGIPGLTTKVTYVKGSDIDGTDADVNGGYVGYYGEDGEHSETDIDIKYVVQEGPAKDLSIRLRQAFHYANDDQGEGDLHEFRVIVDYPLSIL
ncbi:OprD family porin [Aquipseudomonas alcaligenes]|uniref:OprD family porin n=1 Tax=Aquipseudomonas alcaligenes TaxID=43263 RepID=UPI00077FEFCA|nr:OprD family porin [Pseudomonas alcaligenes]AMR68238.1 porin [Pseudomonas alcaligenes]